MSFAARLREARRHAGLNQHQLANACGWDSQSRISMYEREQREPDYDDVRRLAAALKVRPEWLLFGSGPKDAAELVADDAPVYGERTDITQRVVPIAGETRISKDGFWTQESVTDEDGHVAVPSSDPSAYALRIRGDGFAPAIRDGWYVTVEPNRDPVPGEYVLVELRDGRRTIKELLFERGNTVSLMSVADGYGRLTLRDDEIERIAPIGALVPPSKANR